MSVLDPRVNAATTPTGITNVTLVTLISIIRVGINISLSIFVFLFASVSQSYKTAEQGFSYKITYVYIISCKMTLQDFVMFSPQTRTYVLHCIRLP